MGCSCIEDIRALPRSRTLTCACGVTYEFSTLLIHATCPTCGRESHKLRAFGGIGTEIHDVIDAVLEWMGTGDDFERAMVRKRQIDADRDEV